MYNHLFHITLHNLEWKSLSDASPIIICPCDSLSGGPSDLKMPHMGTELIFVTNITNYICGEKIVMWRNFGEILGNFENFWEILGVFATIYALSCGEKLSPKSTFVEKK